MAENRNFLLGYGERLTEPIPPVASGAKKRLPYTLEQSRERLAPLAAAAAAAIQDLPQLACPRDEAVAILTLHPQFIAKTYFPDELLDAADLRAVGSRPAVVTPQAWTRKGEEPAPTPSTELYVAGPRQSLLRWAAHLNSKEPLREGEDELIRIESIRVPTASERLRRIPPTGDLLLEAVLHASNDPAAGYIVAGFEEYLHALGVSLDLERRLYAGGLCFLPVTASRESLNALGNFSFLRVARQMPALRVLTPIERINKGLQFHCPLPAGAPVDTDLRVAVFDGGVASTSPLTTWTRSIDGTSVGPAEPEFLDHGHAVTSALLFGPLREDVSAPTPYAYVDHFRVLDDKSSNNPLELYDVLRRIQDVLDTRQYEFISLSIGPALPIEDDDVHPWTAVLDEHLAEGHALAALAVGNTGELDRASGNARVQVPADCVNALGIGAADTTGAQWKRASYSAIGPGRSPGIIKPDALNFGGSPHEPFYVAHPTTPDETAGVCGTSFATPAAMRIALGVRAHFGRRLSPLALKALLIHAAEDLPDGDRAEIGWGRVPGRIEEIVVCSDDSTRVVYQGELTPAGYLRARLPFPMESLPGRVHIAATFCFATMTDPQDPSNYTRSGLEIVFRPHADRFAHDEAVVAKSGSFFGSTRGIPEVELRRDAHKWETTLHRHITKLGSTLKGPVFDIHYNARATGHATSGAPRIRYALVVTVRCPRVPDFYDRVLRAYATRLEALQPLVEIPVTT